MLEDVTQDFSQIKGLLDQANGITYNVQSIDTVFSQSYPTTINATTSDRQLLKAARQRVVISFSPVCGC